MSPIVHIDQVRAKEAWDALNNHSGDKAEEFANTCKQTAARILTTGLLPALAFLKVKESDGQNGNVMKALNKRLYPFIPDSQKVDNNVLDSMTQLGDAITLRRLTDEALGYLTWLARFADGKKISKSSENGGGENSHD
jgi:CRISPR type III-B/RAMP module-associated protein Cmr5